MTASTSYLDFIRELLAPLGPLVTRRLFSGIGIFIDGAVFAFIVRDTLYFKVDDQTRPRLQAEDSGPYYYEKKDGPHALNAFWRAPERLFDEPDEFLAFARDAVGAARRSATRRKPATKKTRGKPPSTKSPASPRNRKR